MIRYKILKVYIHYICMYWHYTFIRKNKIHYRLTFRNLNVVLYSLFIYSKRKPEEHFVIVDQTRLVCDNIKTVIDLFKRDTTVLNGQTLNHIIDTIITYVVPVYRCYLDNNITVDYLADEVKKHLINYIDKHDHVKVVLTATDMCDIKSCIISLIQLIEMIPDEYTLAEVSLMLNTKLKKVNIITK